MKVEQQQVSRNDLASRGKAIRMKRENPDRGVRPGISVIGKIPRFLLAGTGIFGGRSNPPHRFAEVFWRLRGEAPREGPLSH